MLLLVLLDLSVWGIISGEDGPSQIEPRVVAFKHLSPQMAASSLLPSEATTNICLVPAGPRGHFPFMTSERDSELSQAMAWINFARVKKDF